MRPRFDEYTVRVRQLSVDDGDGFLAQVVECPGCESDGETPEEAVTNARDAFAAWVAAQQQMKRPIPRPSSAASGQFRVRLPKSLHAELAGRAEDEGVSLNTMVLSLLARGVGAQLQEVPPRRTQRASTPRQRRSAARGAPAA